MVKYDRDFRKTYFNITIKTDDKIIKRMQLFGNKSGKTKYKIKLEDVTEEILNEKLTIRVDYGLINKEKLIIKQY